MKTNLNFKVDTPTKNGRIYPRKLLEDELKRKIKKNNLIISKESQSYPHNVIGIVKKSLILEDGSIMIDYDLLSQFKDLEKLELLLSTNGIGNVAKEGAAEIVTELEISNLFFPPALPKFIKCEKCKNYFSLCENFNDAECERKKIIQENYIKIIYS
jgi:uncharacterized protein YkvS